MPLSWLWDKDTVMKLPYTYEEKRQLVHEGKVFVTPDFLVQHLGTEPTTLRAARFEDDDYIKFEAEKPKPKKEKPPTAMENEDDPGTE